MQSWRAWGCRAAIFLVAGVFWGGAVHSQEAAARPRKDAAKFGLYQLNHAAFGGKFNLGNLSPHLNMVLDTDLVLKEDALLFLDISLRYLFPRQQAVQPYVGGGTGVVLGHRGSVPAHLVGGVFLTFDTLPILLEFKIHLENPDALTLWFGLQL